MTPNKWKEALYVLGSFVAEVTDSDDLDNESELFRKVVAAVDNAGLGSILRQWWDVNDAPIPIAFYFEDGSEEHAC